MEKTEIEEQLKNEISKPSSLHISRVPKSTLMRFYELANEEDFANDYGFLIKYLIDFHDGIIISSVEPLKMEVEILKDKMNKLESMIIKPEVKEEYVIMADGQRKIRKR